MVKPGAVVVDVGTTVVLDERGETTVRGDVAPDVASVASALTPVPGGVGPVTVALDPEERRPRRALDRRCAREGAARMSELSHFDEKGAPRMVDVRPRPRRRARPAPGRP